MADCLGSGLVETPKLGLEGNGSGGWCLFILLSKILGVFSVKFCAVVEAEVVFGVFGVQGGS